VIFGPAGIKNGVKILNGTIDTAKLATDAVTTVKILDGAVTAAKIAALTSAQLSAIVLDETGTGLAVFSAGPTFTRTPAAPTATFDTRTTQLATTAFVPAIRIVNLTANAATNSTTTPATVLATTLTSAGTYSFCMLPR